MGFSITLACKAGILILGLRVIRGIIVCKTILLRNGIKEEKIVQYSLGQAIFHQVNQDWKLSQCFARVFGRFLHSDGGLLEDIEFI